MTMQLLQYGKLNLIEQIKEIELFLILIEIMAMVLKFLLIILSLRLIILHCSHEDL